MRLAHRSQRSGSGREETPQPPGCHGRLLRLRERGASASVSRDDECCKRPCQDGINIAASGLAACAATRAGLAACGRAIDMNGLANGAEELPRRRSRRTFGRRVEFLYLSLFFRDFMRHADPLTNAAERRPRFEVNMLDAKHGAYFLPSELTPQVAAHEPSTAETIAHGLGIVRRQIFVVLVFALLGVALGGIFFFQASPKYTATATLLVDTRKIELIQQPTVSNEASIQSIGAMETQVELLRSDEVALRVIRKLNLIGGSKIHWRRTSKRSLGRCCTASRPGYFAESPALSEEERQSLALGQFDKSLNVARIGVTYAIEIDFESRYPDLAAEVANAVADVYIELQRTTEYDAARRASDWLEQRIPEVRAKSEDAQKAVVEYKHEHNIVETARRPVDRRSAVD